MNAQRLCAAVGVFVLSSLTLFADERFKAGPYALSGPYTHENLTIYLIHGKDMLGGKKYLALGEAMEQKKVIVHETGNVNELAIENVSDEDVYVQSGDIVKGGQQDRTLATDLVVSAKSGKVPIAAFCVESGRWRQRGDENVLAFSTSVAHVAGKSMKQAVNSNVARGDQKSVWAQVAESQQKLSETAGVPVAASVSPSSLQLTLENKKVQEAREAYVKAIYAGMTPKHAQDAVGYVMAINGQMNCADVYASPDLFKRMWPKLLDAAGVEAFAERDPEKKSAGPSIEEVARFLTDVQQGKAEQRRVSDRVTAVTKEIEDSVFCETRDSTRGEWLHRNYLAR